MIPSSRNDEPPQTKKSTESSSVVPNGASKLGNTTKTVLSSSRQWSALRNPRIVRVSRAFGGKDRHSKVCTVRGLRDRRIRLSVPTAIQLYDLQERLGLSQPSKVIDWLMESTKDDIDRLPPLQFPQGCSFGQFLQHQSIIGGSVGCSSYSDHQVGELNYNNVPVFFDGNSALFNNNNNYKSKYWDYLDKSKEVERDNNELLNQGDKVSWMDMNHFQGLRSYNNNNSQVLAQNFFPIASDVSGYNPYNIQHWNDQLENRGIITSSTTLHQSAGLLSAASSSSTFGAVIPCVGPQLLVCPPPSTSTFFPVTTTTTKRYPASYSSLEAGAADPRQIKSNFHQEILSKQGKP